MQTHPSGTDTRSDEDHIKKRYERWRTQDVPFGYKSKKCARIARIIRDTGGLTPRTVELGVGPGGIAGPMSRAGTRIVGVDLSWDALLRAKDHCRGDDVMLVRGSGFSLPFRDQSLPVVYSSQVLHLFDDAGRLAIMREVHRVLEPGGRYVFDLKNFISHAWRYLSSSPKRKRTNFPAARQVLHLLDQAGFRDVQMVPGVLPVFPVAGVPNLALFRLLSHTTFYVARRP